MGIKFRSYGKGHSETVDIKSDPLPLNQHFLKIAAVIIEATSGSDFFTPVLLQVQTAMKVENFNPNSLYDAMAIVRIFSEAFSVRYFVLG